MQECVQKAFYFLWAMTQMLAQREHDYFAETVICANCYIVA